MIMRELTTHCNVMVDLETLGLGVNALVLSIGAVAFDITGPKATFSRDIDPESYPGVMDISTVKFWLDQSLKGNACPVKGIEDANHCLLKFDDFLRSMRGPLHKELIIWASGTDFDIPKLQHLYKAFNLPVPWKYNNVRDCRTVFRLFQEYLTLPGSGGKHNALEDASRQTDQLLNILNNLAAFNQKMPQYEQPI